jgi:Peptidoglycan-synthase activator LpoB
MEQVTAHVWRSWIGIAVVLLTAVLAGCGGLQETWEGPGASVFRPASIAVLPPIIGALEGSREIAHEVVTATLKKAKRYSEVMDPEQVNDFLINSNDARETFAKLLSTLESTGLSEQEAAVKLGKALKVDSLLVVRVNSWEYRRSEGENAARVGLSMRLIDTKHGAIVWKGRHEKTKTYMFFKPSLKDMATDLSEYMVKYIP